MNRCSALSLDANPERYEHLRRLAVALVRQESQCTLTATGLVHELFLKSSKRPTGASSTNPGTSVDELFPYASRMMRQILIDRARRRVVRIKSERQATERAGKQLSRVRKDRASLMLVELDDAIDLLAEGMPENAELVRLHLYEGISIEAAAEKLGISRATAFRKWDFSRTWLASKLNHSSTAK
ncbi:MAG: sigma-70 family RNA polymerase sigma factor [Rubripirellula sp.]|nr:sigma-70 family RNA polymerase sigma factor [Rubripirellula sp.]